MTPKENNIIASNPKAKHDYFINETMECGIELIGTEVKSIRDRKVNLKDSYAQIKSGELWVYGIHISPYEKGNIFNKDPMRARRLLIHKKEIQKLIGLVKQQGVTLIPLSLYWNKNHIKLELAVAKGKKIYDKRQDIAKKEAERRMQQLKNE